MNDVKALFFATLRDHVGVRSVELQIPKNTTVASLKSILVERYPMLMGLIGHTLLSVNQEYAFDETVIPDNAEIALFPPVSGG
ncbi:MAG TPA: molybdopterin converting factor subunit 1 [Anaerolineales bacterium]|nr:molybdopterin converting factor subunit 1 [Anaerolineales bacterium]